VKPDPEHLMIALNVLDILPPQAVVVGDHPIDILLGQRVGTVTVGVLTGSSTYGELVAAGAHFIIERVELLINLITERTFFIS
ncbi:MAG: HAD hydrolase-like protein, partial [Syntrophales bacterium]|nr:HAD hydrolase-like protein [Syntrophales bacterium]